MKKSLSAIAKNYLKESQLIKEFLQEMQRLLDESKKVEIPQTADLNEVDKKAIDDLKKDPTIKGVMVKLHVYPGYHEVVLVTKTDDFFTAIYNEEMENLSEFSKVEKQGEPR